MRDQLRIDELEDMLCYTIALVTDMYTKQSPEKIDGQINKLLARVEKLKFK